jgi:hypothetical protein
MIVGVIPSGAALQAKRGISPPWHLVVNTKPHELHQIRPKGIILVIVSEDPQRENKNETLKAAVGLCADCRFMRRMESDRGSTFYLCELSASDSGFPKYPRLPVLRCPGYERLTPDLDSAHD